MSLLFRKISKHKQWHGQGADNTKISLRKLPSDPVADLETTEGVLSVFELDDKDSGLDRIVAAMAISRDQLNSIHYFLFDPELLSNASIGLEPTLGNTADPVVNKQHRDVRCVSALRLLSVAHILWNNAEMCLLPENDVRQAIIGSIRSGYINRSELKGTLSKKILPLLST